MENDAYGFIESMKAKTDHELIECVNSLVGNPGWGNARAHYGSALHREILSRDIDSSAVCTENSMSTKHKIWLDGNTIHILNEKEY